MQYLERNDIIGHAFYQAETIRPRSISSTRASTLWFGAPSIGGKFFLIGEIATRLEEIIYQTAAEHNEDVIDPKIMPDQVHLLCEMHPQYGVNRFVKLVKGRSARFLRSEFPSLRSRLPPFWTGSYFISTFGSAPLDSSSNTSKTRRMSKRSKTPSFICEVPLMVSPHEERQLLIRLDCARQIYNACLGESLKRLCLLRETKEFQAALALPKGSDERNDVLKKLNQDFGFTEFAIHRYATQIRNSWLGEYIDSNTAQKLATRAFYANAFYAFGKHGRPRFKGKGWFDSVEGKTNLAGLRWRGQHLLWTGLELRGSIHPRDPVLQHGLKSRVKYVRLLRRKLNGKNRFYAQLVCEGQPYHKEKNKIGSGVVGLDLGPSNIAIAAESEIVLQRFCDELKSQQKEIRKIQRKLERSRRATNPENYEENGVTKAGRQRWMKSGRYQVAQAQLAEIQRKQAAHRKSLHGQLVNHILSLGDQVNLEKLSYISFQKMYGKSVGFRAPGTFVRHLKRKAENAGVVVNEFPTRTTRLSQVCVCGTIQKKPLSQRWHACACGVGPIQRDLFSAWLARYVDGNKLDAAQAQAAWPRADASLRAASEQVHPAMGQGIPKPNLEKGQSWTPDKPRWNQNKSGEACRDARPVPAGKPVLFPGTPALSVELG